LNLYVEARFFSVPLQLASFVVGGEWHSAVIWTSVATLARNEEKDCRVICSAMLNSPSVLQQRGEVEQWRPFSFSASWELFVSSSVFMWFLNRMTFVVDKCLLNARSIQTSLNQLA